MDEEYDSETKKNHYKKIWKVENFDGNIEDERNYGHTKDEWGSIPHKNRPVKIQTIEAYTVNWDVPSKEKQFNNPNLTKDVLSMKSNTFKCATCGKKFEYFGSAFCSKRCYEDYFVPSVQKSNLF